MPGQLLAPVTRATTVIATRPGAGRAARTTPPPAGGRVPAAGPAEVAPADASSRPGPAVRPGTAGFRAVTAAPAPAPAASRGVRERPWSVARRPRPAAPLPCRSAPDLFFAEKPEHLKQAQELCRICPVREACLAGALERGEPYGVWGGRLFMFGKIIDSKRPRGRPRRVAA